MPQRVAVIGAGVAGLCSLLQLSKDPENFTPVAFDRAKEVGGLWVYTQDTGPDEFGLPMHSSAYEGLRTNTPRELMGFKEYPMPDHYPTYPTVDQVKDYIQDMAKHFDLIKYVKFQTLVRRITPIPQDGGKTKWEVTTRNLITKKDTTEMFDAVMVCNGHETAPCLPDIPGKETFQGTVIHNREYKDSEAYRNKKVVVLGLSLSGSELIYMIATKASQVYACHSKHPNMLCAASEIPPNITQKPAIREITTDGVILTDGEFLECDHIVFATGYHYSFPFLQQGCGVEVKHGRITPLYKHLYHTLNPTLVFIAIVKRAIRFRIASCQAAHVCSVLRGDLKLPSAEDMLKDEEEDYQTRIVAMGKDPKMAHDLFPHTQWDYFDYLEAEKEVKTTSKRDRNHWDFNISMWHTRQHDYKSKSITIVDDETFIIN